MIAAALLVIAIVVVGLGATATLSAIQAADGSLPRVSNVEAAREGTTIIFSWSDPGLAEGDVYQVQVDGGATTLQRTAEFAVAVVEGDTVCVTVSVAREGRVGAPSDEKCAVAE